MKKFLIVSSITIATVFISGALFVLASDDISFTHSISGSLDVQFVDNNGDAIANPTLAFSSSNFSATYQTTTATLGGATQKMRVTNPSGTTDTWSLAMAATSGATAVWTTGSITYDFNDATASAGDGADTDSVGGQMTINPSVGTIAGVGGTSTSNVSKGTQDAFVEGSVDSIDLMTAAAGAQKPGQWDLTGVGVSQTVPAFQGTGSYSISMTLTAS